jgi:hypothetical protein
MEKKNIYILAAVAGAVALWYFWKRKQTAPQLTEPATAGTGTFPSADNPASALDGEQIGSLQINNTVSAGV